MPATYDPERNQMVRLKCDNKAIYLNRKCPIGAEPDPITECQPGVGIHMDCCRCYCPCEIICSDSSATWNDPFDGSGPLEFPWSTSGNWSMNGNSEVELIQDTQGIATVPIDAGGDELVLWLDGRLDETTTPGDIIELGLHANGLFGGQAFALDFYIHRAVSGGLDYIHLTVSVAGADPVDLHIDRTFQPNCDLEIRVYVDDANPDDLTVCAAANNQNIADAERIINVSGTFSSLNAGMRGTAIGTATVYADSFTYCSPSEPIECIFCDPGFQPSKSLYVELPDPFDLGGETGACDCAPVLEKGAYGPLVFNEPLGPNICIWEYEETICTNDAWCPGCGTFGNPITLRVTAQIIGGPPHKWRIIFAVDRDGPTDPTCECSFESIFDTPGWVPPSFGGIGQCNDFPFTATAQNPAFNAGWCGPIPGIGVPGTPTDIILTDINPTVLRGSVTLPSRLPPGTWLYHTLTNRNLINHTNCRHMYDLDQLNNKPLSWWANPANIDKLRNRMIRIANNMQLRPTKHTITRIIKMLLHRASRGGA